MFRKGVGDWFDIRAVLENTGVNALSEHYRTVTPLCDQNFHQSNNFL